MSILDKIQNEIKNDYYQQHFPNDGQRFVAWYLRNIHLLDAMQAKDAMTDGANDKQIDAVYIDDDEGKIFIIQGKYYTSGTIDATPVREVISAHRQLCCDFATLQDNANPKLKKTPSVTTDNFACPETKINEVKIIPIKKIIPPIVGVPAFLLCISTYS